MKNNYGLPVVELDEIKKMILAHDPKAFDKKATVKKKAITKKAAVKKKK